MSDNRCEYTLEKMILYKVKGIFDSQEEAIEKAKTCFDGQAEQLVDFISYTGGVIQSLHTENWEVTKVKPLNSRESFIENLMETGWEKYIDNHFLYRNEGYEEYYYVTTECAWYWNTKDTTPKKVKFDRY